MKKIKILIIAALDRVVFPSRSNPNFLRGGSYERY